jgi:hypothetical protein
MRFRIRLMAVGVAAASCVTFGLTGVTPALAASGANLKSKALAGCLFGNASVGGGVAKRQACNPSLPGEQWRFVGSLTGGELKNGFNQCLGVQGGSTAAGASLVVTACKANPLAPTQHWADNAGGGIAQFNNRKAGDSSGFIHAFGSTGVNQEPASADTQWEPPPPVTTS